MSAKVCLQKVLLVDVKVQLAVDVCCGGPTRTSAGFTAGALTAVWMVCVVR